MRRLGLPQTQSQTQLRPSGAPHEAERASGRTKQKRVKSAVQVVMSEGEIKRRSSADTKVTEEGVEEVLQSSPQKIP